MRQLREFRQKLKYTVQEDSLKNVEAIRDEMSDYLCATKGIIASIATIDDEQDTGITYYFGQELSKSEVSLEEYKNKIENVKKEDVIRVAEKVGIHTIYFLKN